MSRIIQWIFDADREILKAENQTQQPGKAAEAELARAVATAIATAPSPPQAVLAVTALGQRQLVIEAGRAWEHDGDGRWRDGGLVEDADARGF